MFGIDWPELMVIGLVALIVIGPEDLPEMFRQLGRFTAKLRQMSREFSRAMEQAAKDTGVKDVATDLKGMTSARSLGLDAVKDAASKFEKWDPLKSVSAPTMPARSLAPPPMPATPEAGAVVDPVANGAANAADSSAAHSAANGAARSAADDAAEAEDDLAAHAAPVAEVAPENTIHGPATQALYDKQALRAQVLAEQTAKLKAIEAGTYLAPIAGAPVTPPVSGPVAAAVSAAVTGPALTAVAVPAAKPTPRKRKTPVKAVAAAEPVAVALPAKAPRKARSKADLA